jgi:hypothetical protein
VKHRSVAWAKEDPFGVEFAEVKLSADSMSAVGVCVGTDPVAFRLDYTFETGPRFVTSRLVVGSRGEGWHRTLELRRSEEGAWTASVQAEGDLAMPANSIDPEALVDALDCDLGLSPLTNTMPVLREGLLDRDGSAELLTAWVSVPDLSVHVSPQRYTSLGSHVMRYESLDSDFAADIAFDADGLVVDYPGIGRRLRA